MKRLTYEGSSEVLLNEICDFKTSDICIKVTGFQILCKIKLKIDAIYLLK